MGQTKVASAAPTASAPVSTNTIPVPAPRKAEVAETSKAVVAKADETRSEPWPVTYAQPRNDFPAPLPAQPNTSNGIGQGLIGSAPASSTSHAQTMAYADPNLARSAAYDARGAGGRASDIVRPTAAACATAGAAGRIAACPATDPDRAAQRR